MFFLIALFVLMLYTWMGYAAVLKVLPSVRRQTSVFPQLPNVTVLLTVFNAEKFVRERLENILAQEYPSDRLHLLVASDGSTDRTVEEALAMNDDRVSVCQFTRGGKSSTQNAAIANITDEIIVFTDAEARFEPSCLMELVKPFADPHVGCVTGRLLFTDEHGGISRGQGLYWRYETFLRRQESRVGVLATTSGACMAVRTKLFRPLPPTCGEDCMVPLDVVAQGYEVVHVDAAVAYDTMPATPRGELRARIRMTSRNLSGMYSRRATLNPLRYPGYAISLWSHKILRWSTPFLALGIVACSIVLYPKWHWLLFAELIYAILCIVGALSEYWRLPMGRIFSIPFSFFWANLGFCFGVIRFLRGARIVEYANS